MIWIVGLNVFWLALVTLLLIGNINQCARYQSDQDDINELLKARHWSLEERLTMLNDRVNNIKRRV